MEQAIGVAGCIVLAAATMAVLKNLRTSSNKVDHSATYSSIAYRINANQYEHSGMSNHLPMQKVEIE